MVEIGGRKRGTFGAGLVYLGSFDCADHDKAVICSAQDDDVFRGGHSGWLAGKGRVFTELGWGTSKMNAIG